MQGERPRSAASLDPDRGQVTTPQAGHVEDERGDLLLVDKRARGHVPEEEPVEVLRGELGVHERLQPRFDADLAEGTVPELAELRLPDAEDRDVAHR